MQDFVLKQAHPTSIWVSFSGISSIGYKLFPFAIAQSGIPLSVGVSYIEPAMAVLANHASDSYKLGEETKVHGRSMTRGLVIAFTVAVLLAFVMFLTKGYETGGSAMRYIEFKLGC